MIIHSNRNQFRLQFAQAVQAMADKGRSTTQISLANGELVELALNIVESDVPRYHLPNPLASPNGDMITDAERWMAEQRPRILNLFQNEIYGKVPPLDLSISFEERSYSEALLGGRGIRKEVRVWFESAHYRTGMDILIFLPIEAKARAMPLFLGLNFGGNHTTHADPEIQLPNRWNEDNSSASDDARAAKESAEQDRGTKASRWPVEMLIDRGFGLATIYCGDLDPDFDDGFQNGVHPLGYTSDGQRPQPNEWGAIAAWAWGLQKAMDYFEQDEQIANQQVALVGHSRLGKTALWAGALDERFAAVISNNSGCVGAALSARRFGETVAAINLNFPHWLCDNFKAYINQEEKLPVDQHMLLSLIAPRPLYVASAEQDHWADPKGEFLALKEAESVYGLFGIEGLGVSEMPGLDSPILGPLSYHIRTGGHDITTYDWQHYINFFESLTST